MPLENEQEVQNITDQAAPDIQTPEQTTEVTQEATPDATPESELDKQDQEQVAAASQYTPNYKFKFAVEGKSRAEEKEFDEFLRPIIKDADSEKKIRDLYEKAYGLDFVKPRYDMQRQELAQLRPEFEALSTELAGVGKAIQREDYDAVLQSLGIDEKKLIDWAARKVQYLQMTPEEQRRVDADRELRSKAYMGEDEVSQLREANAQLMAQQGHIMLDLAMGRDDVAQVAKGMDAVHGQGAFRREILLMGKMLSDQAGRDLPVDQVVAYAVKKWAPFVKAQASAQADGGESTDDGQGPSKVPRKVPVIPNISSRGGSPAKKVITSLDELKKVQQQMARESVVE